MAEIHDISNHTSLKTLRFFMQLVGMWPVENSREKLISDLSLFYTTTAVAIAVMAFSVDFYYSLGDLQAITYNIPNTFASAIELVKLAKFVMNRSEVMSFNAYTEKTFWKTKYDREECKILDGCNRKSMMMVITHFILAQSVIGSYASMPLSESHRTNVSERGLPISLYFDFPFTESPYYEIVYILETAAGIAVALSATTFAGYLGTTSFYAAGQFKILQHRLERAFHTMDAIRADNSVVTMKINPNFTYVRDCIKHHQLLILYMERVENFFSMIIFAQTVGSVLLLCFIGFQIVLGDTATSFPRFLFSVQFLFIVTVNLFLFAWPCQEIINESQQLAEGAYRASWYCLPYTNEGRICRQSMIIIMARARKPCILTVGKFAPMALQTFGSVFNTSLSYFTVLRHMNEENDA